MPNPFKPALVVLVDKICKGHNVDKNINPVNKFFCF